MAQLDENVKGKVERQAAEVARDWVASPYYADAEKWLGKFLGTIAEAGDSYWQAKARYMLARVKSAKGAGDEAKEQFALARNMASKLGAEQLLKEIIAAESVPSATQQGGPP